MRYHAKKSCENDPESKNKPFLGLYGLILVQKGLPWTQEACVPGLKSFSRPERPNSVSPQRPAWSLMNLFGSLTLGLQDLKTLSTFLTPEARIRPNWPATEKAKLARDLIVSPQRKGDRGPRGPRWRLLFCGNGQLGAIETEPWA